MTFYLTLQVTLSACRHSRYSKDKCLNSYVHTIKAFVLMGIIGTYLVGISTYLKSHFKKLGVISTLKCSDFRLHSSLSNAKFTKFDYSFTSTVPSLCLCGIRCLKLTHQVLSICRYLSFFPGSLH